VPGGSDRATVLVVDDEEEVADVYALRLQNDYETRVAYGGEEGFEQVDQDVDVVLLDRRMPDLSGDVVLERIREAGYDCRVIMLTAIDPGLDIIDMPFDDYLCKPVEKDELVGAIEQQLEVHRYDERLAEYIEASTKLSLLQAELPADKQRESDEIATLKARVEDLRAELSDVLENLDEADDFLERVTGPE